MKHALIDTWFGNAIKLQGSGIWANHCKSVKVNLNVFISRRGNGRAMEQGAHTYIPLPWSGPDPACVFVCRALPLNRPSHPRHDGRPCLHARNGSVFPPICFCTSSHGSCPLARTAKDRLRHGGGAMVTRELPLPPLRQHTAQHPSLGSHAYSTSLSHVWLWQRAENQVSRVYPERPRSLHCGGGTVVTRQISILN